MNSFFSVSIDLTFCGKWMCCIKRNGSRLHFQKNKEIAVRKTFNLRFKGSAYKKFKNG